MSFENDLQEILDELTLSSEDRQSYTEDAGEIRDRIIEMMKESDKEFAQCYDGPSLTGSYLDGLKIELPDEFDINIKFKLPYPIRIVRDSKYPGYLFLQSVNETRYGSKLTDPYTDGVFFVSPVRLQNWIRHIINSIFQGNTLSFHLSSRRTYLITYRGSTVAHTFRATDTKNKRRQISFDFVPSFEFKCKDWISERKCIAREFPWFAVPSPMFPPSRINHFIFKISAPNQERELLKNKNNLKNVLRLLKAIKDHNDMPKLASYMIKSVFLWEIEKQHNRLFWDQPMGVLLIHMLQRLYQCIEKGYIPFYWSIKSNLLDRLNAHQKKNYARKLKIIFRKLKACSINKSEEDIARFFGC